MITRGQVVRANMPNLHFTMVCIVEGSLMFWLLQLTGDCIYAKLAFYHGMYSRGIIDVLATAINR